MRKTVFLLILPILFTWVVNYDGKGHPLTLTISTDSRMYFAGDKIKITYEWENISGEEVRFIAIPKQYSFGKSWIRVYDTAGKEMERKEFQLEKEKVFGKEAFVSLKPGEKHSYTLEARIGDSLPAIDYTGLCLDFGDSAILLDGYGNYKLKADLEFPFGWYYENSTRVFVRGLWQGILKSNEVSVKIMKY